MGKYSKKSVVVEAVKWTGKNTSAIRQFCPSALRIYDGRKIAYLLLPTLGSGQGRLRTDKNDWIIKDVKGKFYPCKPDIFEQTYEKVS